MDLKNNSLYREIIMEHSHHPKNANLNEALKKYSIKNPTCGDSVTIQVEVQNGVIAHIYQNSIGCVLSTASTSIMSEWLIGKTVKEAKYLIQNYIQMVKGEPYDTAIAFDDAQVFEGVASYPARSKCATVSYEALLKALNDKSE